MINEKKKKGAGIELVSRRDKIKTTEGRKSERKKKKAL